MTLRASPTKNVNSHDLDLKGTCDTSTADEKAPLAVEYTDLLESLVLAEAALVDGKTATFGHAD